MTNATAVDQGLSQFTEAVKSAFAEDLLSVVLFGSAAEGRLRTTSDVNVIVVLKSFDPSKADALRQPLRDARVAIALMPMFILESELAAAAEAFAVKFEDISRRRRVLHGPDPFAKLTIPRSARVTRLRQVTLNQALRLRERYVERSLREEQLALAIADAAGPLRTAASTLLELEGAPAGSPREALETIARDPTLMGTLSQARERGLLPPGVGAPALLKLIEIARTMHVRATKL